MLCIRQYRRAKLSYIKMLSNTLRQIEFLAEEIKKTNPETYQYLLLHPIPIPAEFMERNNPTGLRDHLLYIESYLTRQLETLKAAQTAEMEDVPV